MRAHENPDPLDRRARLGQPVGEQVPDVDPAVPLLDRDRDARRRRRRMRPLEWRVARIGGYRLRFNLEGRPKGKAAPANIEPCPGEEVWGVVYRITRRDLVRLDSTEGVPGGFYRRRWLGAEDADRRPLEAVAYIAQGKETDGNPSIRYIALLREGARAHGLPGHWIEKLERVRPADG